jgi:hypothetical protein
MKTYGGSGSLAPHILNLGTRRRWGVGFHVQSALMPGEEPPVPTRHRSRSERGGKRNISGNQTQIHQPSRPYAGSYVELLEIHKVSAEGLSWSKKEDLA